MPLHSTPPRLLLLTGEAPHTQAAGGIYFHRLLADYPADRLCVVTNHLPPAGAERLRCPYILLRLVADRLNRTRLWPWRARLRALGASSLVRLARVDAAVRDFKPDIVITLMQDSWFYDLAARYASEKKLPLVLFIHDLSHGFEPVPAWMRPWQTKRDQSVLRQAALRFCVSEGMADYFQGSLNLSSEILHPPRSTTPPAQPPEACRELKTPGRLTLGYAGGLHYGYGEQLLRMLPALRATGAHVEIFGPVPAGVVAPLAEATDVFHFNGYAASPEVAWSTLLERCDAILLPYLNPPGAHELQYNTHFPSKLGDCLSLGMPLLITGCPSSSGSCWCAGHAGSALQVTSAGDDAITAALLRLKNEPDLRVTLAEKGLQAAAFFDAGAARAQMLTALQRLMETRKLP